MRSLSEMSSNIDSKPSLEEIQSYLDEKISKSEIQFLLSNKTTTDDVRHIIESKLHNLGMDENFGSLNEKINDVYNEINKKMQQLPTIKDINGIAHELGRIK